MYQKIRSKDQNRNELETFSRKSNAPGLTTKNKQCSDQNEDEKLKRDLEIHILV